MTAFGNAGQTRAQGGALTVDATGAVTNSSALVSSETVTIDTDGVLTNAAGGEIVSAGGVVLTADSFTNAGRATARGGALTATVSKGVTNRGTGALGASGTLAIGLGGDLSNAGSIVSQGAMTLAGLDGGRMASLTALADSTINGAAGLTARAADLTNAGGIGSADGKLDVELSGFLSNTGLLYGGTAVHFKLDGAFTNDEADVLAETDLTVEGLTGARAGALINSSGAMEAVSGDVTLKAASVTNERHTLTVGETSTTEETTGGDEPGTVHSSTTTTVTTQEVLTEDSLAAQILAGGDIEIQTGTLSNSYSQIAANGDVTITADTATNTGRDLIETVVATRVENHRLRYCDSGFAGICFDWDWRHWTETETDTESSTHDAVYGTIEAGGTLTATVTGYLSNNAVRGSASQIGLASGDRALANPDLDRADPTDANQAPPHVEAVDVGSGTGDRVETEQVAAVDVGSGTGDRAEAEQVAAVDVGAGTGDRVEVEPGKTGASTPPAAADPAALDVSIDSLLRRRALFEVETAPNMPYLIETRPDFVDSSKFLGSDYFLSRAGLEAPDRTMKRLGDAYVEHRLVRDQIFEATGSRYLAGFIDMRAQMQALYDNALGQQQRLDLAVGVALTREQVSGLTADILWLERITVRGQQVLVPRLYLSSATRDDIDFESARLHGARTVVRAGTLVNSGRVAGIDGLDIRTTHALLNTGGALASESDIHIDAGALFGNISGTVSGNNVWIAAGVIQHDTAKTLDRYDNGFAERVQQIARIEARGDLRLDAGHSILSTGGVLRSEGSTTLTSGGDIALTALPIERFREDEIRGGYSRSASLVHRLGSVRAGGALAVEAGNRLTLRGVKADAGGDARLAAGGDVEIASVQDRRSDDLKIEIEGGGLFGVDTDIRRQDAAVETKRTAIAAGGDLSIRSDKGDIALVAPRLESKGETVLEAAEGKLALLTAKDASFAQDRERSEDLLWWKERDKGHSREIVRHVEIEAGGGLVIRAGEGVLAEYRKTGSLEASLDQLEQSPGLAWVGQLRDDPKADWRGVEAAFKEWDYEAQGLTEAGAALVSLIAVAATAGTLSTLSAAIAKGLGIAGQGAMHVAMQGAIKAGLTSLVSQASVALVNNRGDLGATLKQLGSSATLTSLATAMITAGLTSGIESAIGIGADLPASAPLADRVVHDLQRNLLRNTVRAGVTTAMHDGEIGEALVDALRMTAAQTIGEVAAEEIGTAYRKAGADGIDPWEYGLHKAVHAALGCGAAAVAGTDCGSAAVGAAAGEIFAEAVFSRSAAAIEDLARKVHAGELSEKEARIQIAALTEEVAAQSQVAAAVAAIAVGAESADEIRAAADAGGNAAQNNAAETPWDLFSLSVSLLELNVAIAEGNVLNMLLAGAAVVVDGAAVFVPLMPGGAGVILSATRQGGKLVAKVDPASPYHIRVDPGLPGRPDPQHSIDTSTFTSGKETANAGIRDSKKFWKEWTGKPDSGLSETNLDNIRKGISPVVDDEWLRVFPEHREFVGIKLDHHHVEQGRYAIPLPKTLHRMEGNFKTWHPPGG